MSKTVENKDNRIAQLKNIFSIPNIIIYFLTALLSIKNGINGENTGFFVSFSVALLAASVANRGISIIIFLISEISLIVVSGVQGSITFLIIALLFTINVLLLRPYEEDNRNEKRRVALHILIPTFIVFFFSSVFRNKLGDEFVYILANLLLIFVLYKVFIHAMATIKSIRKGAVLSLEEYIAFAIMIILAIASFAQYTIYGFNIVHIIIIALCMFIGYRNGPLIGIIAGLLFGLVYGIETSNLATIILTLEISGIISGMFSLIKKHVKLCIALFIILGNVVLAFALRGNPYYISCEEVLIATFLLFLLPEKLNIKFTDFFSKEKLLPKETVKKIQEKNTPVEDAPIDGQIKIEDLGVEVKNVEKDNRASTLCDLYISKLEELKSNILYEDIRKNENKFIKNISKIVVEKQDVLLEEIESNLKDINVFISLEKESNKEIIEEIKAFFIKYKDGEIEKKKEKTKNNTKEKKTKKKNNK